MFLKIFLFGLIVYFKLPLAFLTAPCLSNFFFFVVVGFGSRSLCLQLVTCLYVVLLLTDNWSSTLPLPYDS